MALHVCAFKANIVVNVEKEGFFASRSSKPYVSIWLVGWMVGWWVGCLVGSSDRAARSWRSRSSDERRATRAPFERLDGKSFERCAWVGSQVTNKKIHLSLSPIFFRCSWILIVLKDLMKHVLGFSNILKTGQNTRKKKAFLHRDRPNPMGWLLSRFV